MWKAEIKFRKKEQQGLCTAEVSLVVTSAINGSQAAGMLSASVASLEALLHWLTLWLSVGLAISHNIITLAIK